MCALKAFLSVFCRARVKKLTIYNFSYSIRFSSCIYFPLLRYPCLVIGFFDFFLIVLFSTSGLIIYGVKTIAGLHNDYKTQYTLYSGIILELLMIISNCKIPF